MEPSVEPVVPLVFGDGKNYQRTQKSRKWFNRTKVLEEIKSRYGQDEADEIDFQCKIETKTAKRLHVKLFDAKE